MKVGEWVSAALIKLWTSFRVRLMVISCRFCCSFKSEKLHDYSCGASGPYISYIFYSWAQGKWLHEEMFLIWSLYVVGSFPGVMYSRGILRCGNKIAWSLRPASKGFSWAMNTLPDHFVRPWTRKRKENKVKTPELRDLFPVYSAFALSPCCPRMDNMEIQILL